MDLYLFDFKVAIDAIARGRDKAMWSHPFKLNNLKVLVLKKHNDNKVENKRFFEVIGISIIDSVPKVKIIIPKIHTLKFELNILWSNADK